MKIIIEIEGADEGISSSTIKDMCTLIGRRFGAGEEPEAGQTCIMGEWEGYPFSYRWERG